MQSLRKLSALLLAAALILSLAGCAAPAGSGAAEQTDQEKLYAILDDIVANVQPGTTGSFLRAVGVAAKLVKWAKETEMSKQEAAQAVMQWLKDQPQETKDAFRDSMKQIAEAYGRMAVDGAKDLLESAGVPDSLGEMTDRLKEIVEAILASGGID